MWLLSNIQVSEENFGSDHQALKGQINMVQSSPMRRWAKPNWGQLDPNTVCNILRTQLEDYPPGQDVNKAPIHLSTALQTTQLNFGCMVSCNMSWIKSCWNPEWLNPILKTRNQTQWWMLLSKLEEAYHCYKKWNDYFWAIVREMKQTHWR